jgi:glyoxylase-like metal-dependent hydrolase (beta-lactamase superfamily II)
MKRLTLPVLLVTLALLAALCAGLVVGLRSLLEGGEPMTEDPALAGGRVERVIDRYTSAWIVEGTESVLLVDAGMDPAAPGILAALARRGREPTDVQAIVLTHGHGDHIGGVSAFPQASLMALEAEVDLVEGRRVADNLVGRFRSAEPTGLTVARALGDGEVLDIAGLRVEVFAVPGHSRGSAVILCEGVLFLGDAAASTVDGRLTGPPPGFSADREEGARSLRALAERLTPRATEIRWLCPSHQGCLEGPEALLAWAE